MIECIFTIDYEIYGNGEGSLKELVFEPAKQLKRIFDKAGAKFVVFVEVAELDKIDALRSDPAIDDVKDQIREFYREGFEIGLHLHPQWCNAQYSDRKWQLDYTEYNLCTLSAPRINEIVSRSIHYLRYVLGTPDFTPISFRAGNWLFQPTDKIAPILAEHGVKIDSSAFKGGRQRKHKLDYREASKNGYYWAFGKDVITPDPYGPLLEIPIYTKMVPFWKMFTAKRVALQQKAASGAQTFGDRLNRALDLVRLRNSLKFDFCRMTEEELVTMMQSVICEDQNSPKLLKPIVAIGHTKDLVDFGTINLFLSFLKQHAIKISTFEDIYRKCEPVAFRRTTTLESLTVGLK